MRSVFPIAFFGLFLWMGLSTMFGLLPASLFGWDVYDRFLALADRTAATYGPVNAGLGMIGLGVLLTAMCFIDTDNDGGIGFSGWGDGGDCGD